ncbi:MAG: efflux RND transporter periplasmic adaptor subunit [Candidatus Aminicenantes bacterium]
MAGMIFPKKILLIFFIALAAGVSVYFIFISRDSYSPLSENTPQSSQPERKFKEPLIPVKVVQAKKGDLIIRLKSPAEAVSEKKIIIRAEVPGVIKALNVEESQHVRKGDLLVELNDREHKLDLEVCEVKRLRYLSEMMLEEKFSRSEEPPQNPEKEKMHKAREEYEKARKLYRKGMISEKEFENASREYELAVIASGERKKEVRAAVKGLTQAEIEVKKARLKLEKTKVRAPFSGIVYDIQVSPHEHITNSKKLFTLIDISRIRVHAKILESEISRIRVGREADLSFSAYPGKVFKGEVKALSPVVDPEDRTCRVIIGMKNPQEEIKPGMHAEVEIAAQIYKDRLLIPQQAVLVRGGRKLAFVVEEGLAKWRYIEVGRENEDYAEVLDGLKERESVILEGHFTLAHDTRVKVIE